MGKDSTTRAQVEQIVADYERGVNEGDLELIMSLFSNDAVFYDPVGWMDEFKDVAELQPEGLQPAFKGKEGLEQFFFRVATTFPNLSYKVEWLFVSEDPSGAAFEWRGYSEKDGKVLHARAVDVFEVAEGKVTTGRGYIANPNTVEYA
ncbi:MAG: nuclear transport factor 2 family protein [Gaiellaceae bacterium]